MTKLVVFDMDGVLADAESSWVHVHKCFGVNNDHSLRAYLQGEIDDLEFIRRDIALWREKEPGVTAARIKILLSDVPLMNGAEKALEELKSRGVRTAIVSAGIDLLADMIAERIPIDIRLANGMKTDERGTLTGEGILRVKLTEKGEAVSRIARRFRLDREEVAAVGNSRYDVSMFKASGRGIAFNPEDEDVRKQASAVVEEKDLTKILDLV